MRIAIAVSLCIVVCVFPFPIHADEFDNYTNKVLQKIPNAKGVTQIKQLTRSALVDHAAAVPGISGAFLVVHTNEGRWAKLIVHPARQKISKDQSLPILLIERFVTYREGEDKAVVAEAKNVRLFKDFLLNLDLGQIVPASVGGDIRFVVKDNKAYAEPVGKAVFYLVAKPLPDAKPPKSKKVVVRDPFVPQYFTGKYKLYDDGRRSGQLQLKVSDDGIVAGHFYSDKDGRKYPVSGKVGEPHHMIDFRITFPRTLQTFRGWMFTGDGSAITGAARMQQRETGFYARRIEGKE